MADASPEPIDTLLVRELAAILNDTDLSEIEVERGDLKIRVARSLMVAPAAPVYAPAPVAVAAAAPAPSAETLSAPALPAGEPVKSPMVGTVYLSPQPGAATFVKVGDTVSAGQTMMIIEAMKTMNPIPAPRAGVIRAIRVADGDPVEFGEPLAIIE
jgi:acetyl-CoA carboxylase biotin carboxyl carrier protein